MLTQEQLVARQKFHLECLVNLTSVTLESFGVVTGPNLHGMHSVFARTRGRDVVENESTGGQWFAQQTSLALLATERLQDWSRRWYEVAAATHTEWIHATCALFEGHSQRAGTLVEAGARDGRGGFVARLPQTLHQSSQQKDEDTEANLCRPG